MTLRAGWLVRGGDGAVPVGDSGQGVEGDHGFLAHGAPSGQELHVGAGSFQGAQGRLFPPHFTAGPGAQRRPQLLSALRHPRGFPVQRVMTPLTQHPEAFLLLSRGQPLDSRSIFFCRFEVSHRVHSLTGKGQKETSLFQLS